MHSSRTQLNEFTELLLDTKRTIFHQFGKTGMADPFSAMQFEALRAIERAGTVSMRDVAAALHVRPPTITALMRKMVAAGYVQRVPDPDDGRSVRLQITRRGRAMMKQYTDHLLESMQNVFAPLDDEELEQLITIFTKLRSHHTHTHDKERSHL